MADVLQSLCTFVDLKINKQHWLFAIAVTMIKNINVTWSYYDQTMLIVIVDIWSYSCCQLYQSVAINSFAMIVGSAGVVSFRGGGSKGLRSEWCQACRPGCQAMRRPRNGYAQRMPQLDLLRDIQLNPSQPWRFYQLTVVPGCRQKTMHLPKSLGYPTIGKAEIRSGR